MNNPYQVLGITRNASEEEIKKAYKSLSRKYHPDANINNPNKDQAEDKFKEIQTAYQQIMKERTEGHRYTDGNQYGSTSYGGTQYHGGQGYYENTRDDFFGGFGGFGGNYRQGESTGYEEDLHLRAAGNYIRSGYYREARTTLDGMDMQERNARWFYYSAITNAGLGNNVSALEHAKKAVAMEPDNTEYRSLVYQFENGGSWYQQRQATYGYPVMNGNNICMKICIANMVCNLCCGSGGMFCGG